MESCRLFLGDNFIVPPCICVCVCLPNLSATRSFLRGVKLRYIQSFPFLRLVARPSLKIPVCLTIYPQLRDDRWIYVFSTGIRTKWNANNFVQDLNSGRRSKFPRRCVWKWYSWNIPLEACGVIVIVVGNGHGDTSSNPGRDWLHFT